MKKQPSGWFWAGFFALFFFGLMYTSVIGWLLLLFAIYALHKYFKGDKR